MRRLCIFLSLLLFSTAGHSATFYVPDNFASIQAAIDSASDGDCIIVRSGVYVENIDFLGKAITVRSENGPHLTTIDGNWDGSVVVFRNGEDPDSVLEGFTLTNGDGTRLPIFGEGGGGIYCENSSPTITGNIITGNDIGWDGVGGGIYCIYGSPLVDSNVISDNAISFHGQGCGGICFIVSNAIISNNLIENNRTVESRGGGGGFYDSTPTLMNNLIVNNYADESGGGFVFSNSPALIVNNVFSENRADGGGGIYCFESDLTITNNIVERNRADGTWRGDGGGIDCNHCSPAITNSIFRNNISLSGSYPEIRGNPIVRHSNVKGGWPGEGNIDEDPLFLNLAALDYHIPLDSPCVNAGTDTAPGLPLEDFEGDPRSWQGLPDIGVDEFHRHLYHEGDVVPGTTITIIVIGEPTSATPVTLGIGSGVLDPPMTTQYGSYYLQSPVWSHFIGNIPSNGVLQVPATVPTFWQSGESKPLQALLGPMGSLYSKLTNLHVLEVQ